MGPRDGESLAHALREGPHRLTGHGREARVLERIVNGQPVHTPVEASYEPQVLPGRQVVVQTSPMAHTNSAPALMLR